MKRDFGIYQVGLKLLLKKDGKLLMLRLNDGRVDFPGGRIDNVEYTKPLEKILAREVKEELGKSVKYKLGNAAFQFHFPNKDHAIYVTVFEGDYISGAITLSHEHASYTWVDPKTLLLKAKDYPHSAVYRAFKKYFNDHY